ncbi:hypothetical protein KL923_001015 [Ogataea haglerorum]|nr:hypothetical protein KL923_001015 [Ogataea haglerorum]
MNARRAHQFVRRCLHNRPKCVPDGEGRSDKVSWANSVFGNYVRRIVEPTFSSIEMYLSDQGADVEHTAKHTSNRNEYEYLNLRKTADIRILNSRPYTKNTYIGTWKRSKDTLRPHHVTLLSSYVVNGTIDELPTILEFLLRTRWFTNASILLNGADMSFKDFLDYINALLVQQFDSDWSRKEFLRHLVRELSNPRILLQIDRKDLLVDLELANQLEDRYLETDYPFEILQLHLERISNQDGSDIIESTKLKLLIRNIKENVPDPKLQVKEFFRVAETFEQLFANAPDSVGFFILACVPHMEKDTRCRYFSSAFFESFLMLHITVNDVRIILDKLILNEKQLQELWEFCKSPDMWLQGQFFQHRYFSKHITDETFSKLPPSMQRIFLTELSKVAGDAKELQRIFALGTCICDEKDRQAILQNIIKRVTTKHVNSTDDWLQLLKMLLEFADKLPSTVIWYMTTFGACSAKVSPSSSHLKHLVAILEHQSNSYGLLLMNLVLRWFITLRPEAPDRERKRILGDLFAKPLDKVKDLPPENEKRVANFYILGSKVPKVVPFGSEHLIIIRRQLKKLDNDSISYIIGNYVDSLFTEKSYTHQKVHKKVRGASFTIDILFRLVLDKGPMNWDSFVETSSILDNYTLYKSLNFQATDSKTRRSLIKVMDSTVDGLAENLLTGYVPRYRYIKDDQEEIGLEKLKLVCSKLENEGYITDCSDHVKTNSMVSREDALEQVRLQATVHAKMRMVHSLLSTNPHLIDKVLEKYYIDYSTDIPPALIHQMMICIMESEFNFSEKLKIYRYLEKLALKLVPNSINYAKYQRGRRAAEVLIDKLITDSWKEGYDHKLLISTLTKRPHLFIAARSRRWSALLKNMKIKEDGFWKERHR